MDDLVERLRAYAKDWRDRAASQEVVLEAADRIEALQAEVARLRDALDDVAQSHISRAHAIARQALKGTDNAE